MNYISFPCSYSTLFSYSLFSSYFCTLLRCCFFVMFFIGVLLRFWGQRVSQTDEIKKERWSQIFTWNNWVKRAGAAPIKLREKKTVSGFWLRNGEKKKKMGICSLEEPVELPHLVQKISQQMLSLYIMASSYSISSCFSSAFVHCISEEGGTGCLTTGVATRTSSTRAQERRTTTGDGNSCLTEGIAPRHARCTTRGVSKSCGGSTDRIACRSRTSTRMDLANAEQSGKEYRDECFTHDCCEQIFLVVLCFFL